MDVLTVAIKNSQKEQYGDKSKEIYSKQKKYSNYKNNHMTISYIWLYM